MQTSENQAEWRRLQPAMLLLGFGDILRRNLVPVLLAMMLQKQRTFILIFVFFGFILSLFSLILRFISLRYLVDADHITIHEGIFSKKIRRIPIKRIHNINVRQNIAARLLGVVRLDIETAGGGAAEATLVALTRSEADEIIAIVREGKKEAGILAPSDDVDEQGEEASDAVYRISLIDILVAGATTSRIGLVLIAIAGVFQYFDEAIFQKSPEWIQRSGQAVESLRNQSWLHVILVAGGTILLLFFISWLISIISAFVRWHRFTLRSHEGDLSIRTGLFTVRDYTFPIKKIQALQCRMSAFRRPWGLIQIFVQSAGHVGFQDQGSLESDLLVPITHRRRTRFFVETVWPESRWDEVDWQPVHIYTRNRHFRILLFLGLLLSVAIFFLMKGASGALGLATAVFVGSSAVAFLVADQTFRQTAYGRDQQFVYIKTGFIGLHFWVIPIAKIQNAAVEQNPFQRYYGLASLRIDVAGGGEREAVIPNIDVGEAWLLFNRFVNPEAPRTQTRNGSSSPSEPESASA
ncbi:PH domain-containing protein [Sulfidibacter corallicola]|uniref:PH domain-containing protein n=1 Tax=Sulfidibacter corallicola TaxID=2818388 RepID=A0A8A4TWQ2_SULCO|nr:PH domain-containing protein [Sulfidibacter corallicola]QTD53777.1 PH domain-containing protein [Sulfidibacter corallicola]